MTSHTKQTAVKCGHVTVPLSVVLHLADLLDSGQLGDISPKRVAEIIRGLALRIEQTESAIGPHDPAKVARLLEAAGEYAAMGPSLKRVSAGAKLCLAARALFAKEAPNE